MTLKIEKTVKIISMTIIISLAIAILYNVFINNCHISL